MHSSRQFELPLEVSVEETHARVRGSSEVALIDVREPQEHSIARLDGAELIPMGTVPQMLGRLEKLSDEKELIVLCHHGVRSLQVAEWLRRNGIENVQSMQGGIDAWSKRIDPAVPRY